MAITAATPSSSTSTAVDNNNTPTSRAQTEARAAILASLESAGSNYDTRFQRRATDLHANAAAIGKQESELKKQTAALAKESAKWQKEVDKATKGLNQFGDVQNWAEVMEREFCVLEETMRLVEGRGNGEGERSVAAASGGSQWR